MTGAPSLKGDGAQKRTQTEGALIGGKLPFGVCPLARICDSFLCQLQLAHRMEIQQMADRQKHLLRDTAAITVLAGAILYVLGAGDHLFWERQFGFQGFGSPDLYTILFRGGLSFVFAALIIAVPITVFETRQNWSNFKAKGRMTLKDFFNDLQQSPVRRTFYVGVVLCWMVWFPQLSAEIRSWQIERLLADSCRECHYYSTDDGEIRGVILIEDAEFAVIHTPERRTKIIAWASVREVSKKAGAKPNASNSNETEGD
jgi:hypothetical protein